MELLGVDIGGSGIKGAVVDTTTGKLLTERVRIKTPQPSTPQAVAATIKELVETIGYKGPVACGFPARVINGVVLTAANIDKSWVNVHVENMLSKELGTDVYVANDADVAGLAEMCFGAGRNEMGKVLIVTIGTGLGTAMFFRGELLPNFEMGHIILNGDDAERYCSDSAREKLDLKWKEFGKRFNEYLNRIEFLVQPDLFILGGGASKKFDKFSDRLSVGSARVIPAETLNLAGIIGAAMYCERRLNEKVQSKSKSSS
ncbi:polyphosphate--glucose phosphotransferase [Anaerobiospirillum sp. NML120449]|uniref:polyphosphate--glucose phosphotransferase n=1 Tax=Anaerobiospirillum sp. NML120449 TaxID=2932817 RepID=UPI001FF6D8BB|nr:ROK family protein [Anaerobiospirillum sp. NML120449]MCK0525671.1 ROK family protein [Anaerobiospirillum sp. NML120449]